MQQLGLLQVSLAQAFYGANRPDQMALRRLLGQCDQRIRDTSQRRNHDDRALVGAGPHDSPRS